MVFLELSTKENLVLHVFVFLTFKFIKRLFMKVADNTNVHILNYKHLWTVELVWLTWNEAGKSLIFSNYWMRLSWIWRIRQVEESVIHWGRRPRWITPSEICRILHILRKPNSIIALLFIQNTIFAQTCELYSQPFPALFVEWHRLVPTFSRSMVQ